MAQKRGNRGKTGKVGAHRAAFDQAAALDALKWATGGQQLEIPGVGARRFVGVEPLGDDAAPRQPGRPPGAVNLVPQAFREYLAAKYGSPVEGLAQFANRPVVAIVAELVEAFQSVATVLGVSKDLTRAELLELVRMVPALQLQARRYAAPYMHTQAPQPKTTGPVERRIGMVMVTGNAPPGAVEQAKETLAELLGFQGLNGPATEELDADELDGTA
jgi:hypothetical protein